MAQDYDSPKDKNDDDAVAALAGGAEAHDGSDVDDDETAIAENFELPGADLSSEDASVTVIPMQGNEFVCSECFLVKHRSQLAFMRDGQPVCKECAA
ncbi:MAG: DUF4193 domain-containing protein [Aeriscardovia sp.]|nr:DUF4193 domain-containing protein [Aeriscardovia sp.]